MTKIRTLVAKAISVKGRFGKMSYSQCGEDCIVEFMFSLRKITRPSYIDIGAFHPYALSNTAKFHLNGSVGITIEPNPDQYKYFLKYRKGAVNLNLGVGKENGELTYYKMNVPTMNTFDADAARDLVENQGFVIVDKVTLPIMRLTEIIKEYAGNKFPDFLSLDVEGFDEQILGQIDYENNYPKIICVETMEFTHDGTGKKNEELINFLLSKNYLVYADTYINSIFVNKKFWLDK
jgi:FkbM family methyltransferase